MLNRAASLGMRYGFFGAILGFVVWVFASKIMDIRFQSDENAPVAAIVGAVVGAVVGCIGGAVEDRRKRRKQPPPTRSTNDIS